MDFTGLDNLSSAYAESRILHAAVELSVFDAIGDDRVSAEDVAGRLETDIRATTLLLNALTALNLVAKESNLYSLTGISRKYLLSASESCYTGMILFESAMWDAWGRLAESVRTGQPARSPDMYQSDRKETERFITAMHHLVTARGDADHVVDRINLGDVQSILDIGSGPGTYPMSILKRYPGISITILDLPGTLEITRKILEYEHADQKIDLISADYNRDPLPQGFDIVFLSNIIHSEDEVNNRRLMKNIYRSLKPGGRVIIKDHIMDESLTRPAAGAIFSIYMLLTTRGRDYSYQEIKGWLEEAGFSGISVEALSSPMTSSLVIGRK